MPGTPANSPRVGAPRFANADGVDFAGQVNGVTDAFDAKVVIDQASTFALRPAANTVSAGTYHFSTDSGVVARSDGTNWSEVGRALGAAGLTIGGDVNLYRVDANALRTDDEFSSIRATGTANVLGAGIVGDNRYRMQARADGVVEWSSGVALPDTNLYRAAADQLQTDDSLYVGGARLRLTQPAAELQLLTDTSQVVLGATGDTRISRPAAGIARINGSLQLADGALHATSGVENLRTLRGTVNADGTIARGSGFTVTKGGVGIYTITYGSAFVAIPSVVATPGDTGQIAASTGGGVGFSSASDQRIVTYNSSGTQLDLPFSFIASGPR